MQGDRERALKLPVSPLMDRTQQGGMTRSQVPCATTPLHAPCCNPCGLLSLLQVDSVTTLGILRAMLTSLSCPHRVHQ